MCSSPENRRLGPDPPAYLVEIHRPHSRRLYRPSRRRYQSRSIPARRPPSPIVTIVSAPTGSGARP